MNLNGRLSFTGNMKGSMGAQLVANVEANPSGAPSQTLVSIRVGDVIYSIPSGGGGGGTSDYNALNNKPKVNNVILAGDLTLADLGIQPAISFPGDASKYLDGNGSFSTPAAGVDYSTSEQNTGIKWVDGKYIYVKTLRTYDTYTSNTALFNVGDINVIKITGTVNVGTAEFPAPFFAIGSFSSFIATFHDIASQTIQCANYGWTIGQYNIIIYYTKN